MMLAVYYVIYYKGRKITVGLNWRRTKIACYMGFITQAININLAPLLFIIFQKEFGFTFEQIGRIILINFCTQILSDVVATKYVDRVGYRVSVLAALAFSVLGLTSLSFLPQLMRGSYAGLIIPVVLYSFGSGLIEVLVSPLVEAMPGDEKASMMSLMHSFYCWGQMAVVLITTLLLWWLGDVIWPVLPLMWAIVPAVDFFVFLKAPLGSIVAEGSTPMKVRDLFKSGFFWIAMMLMVCSGSSELTMAQWASLFAEKGLGVSKLLGDLLGPFLFAFFMAITRAGYGVLGSKINIHKALIVSGALCIVCYGLTVFAKNPFISLIGCAVSGVSVALMWPGTLSFSAARFPLGGTALYGVLAICGDLGGAFAPWLAGVVSDAAQKAGSVIKLAADTGMDIEQLGLKAGLMVSMIFPVMMFITLILLKRNAGKE